MDAKIRRAKRFQAGRISREIDEFNAANKKISENYGVAYCDITPISKEALKEKDLIAKDLLHPSGKMYGRWVKLLLGMLDLK